MSLKLKKEHEEDVPDRPALGLADGGHIILSCSNCRAGLVDVWRTRPDSPFHWKMQATCPFCGDRSFVQEIAGSVHVGGCGVVKEDDPDDDVPSTVVDGQEIRDDVILFTVKKARPDARAILVRD